MIYEAGKVQAVQGELSGASNADMQYDAGEVEAIRGILGTPTPGMLYGVTNAIGLKMALSNAGTGDESQDVESKAYAKIDASHKMWGSQKLESSKVIVTTTTGFSVEVNAIADDTASSVTISPAAYYTDNGLLRSLSQAFDFFMDDNGYLKIITDKEYFIYLDATKKTKIRATNVQIDSKTTPRMSLFASPYKDSITTAFKCFNSAGQEVLSVTMKPHTTGKPSIDCEFTPSIYNKEISSAALRYLLNLGKYGFNFIIKNSQLTLVWNNQEWPLWFDKITDKSQSHTQPITCDYITVVS